MTSVPEVCAQARKAMKAAAVALFDGEDVGVKYTDIGNEYHPDMVFIGAVQADQQAVTTNRGREVTITIEVQVHSHRSGADEADEAAFDAMVSLASRLSEHFRAASTPGNTTLGGVVRDCFEVEFAADSAPVTAQAGRGRVWVGIVIYEAHARLRG